MEDVEHFITALYRREERMGMERLMNETVERWQEMEVKDKVVSLDGR